MFYVKGVLKTDAALVICVFDERKILILVGEKDQFFIQVNLWITEQERSFIQEPLEFNPQQKENITLQNLYIEATLTHFKVQSTENKFCYSKWKKN